MAIKDKRTGRHIFYEADHGIQRDPLRDAIRDKFPTSREGWNVNDVDLRVCLFGSALGIDPSADGWFIEFEAKKKGADLKYSQERVMVLDDKLKVKGDPEGRYWGGSWHLKVPEDLENGIFQLFRPLNKKRDACFGIDGLRDWIKETALRQISKSNQKQFSQISK